MSLFAAAPLHLTRLELMLWAEVIVVFYLLLVCFIRVSGYVANRFWVGKLVNGVNAPLPIRLPFSAGWFFAFSVLCLLFLQSPLYYLVVVVGIVFYLLVSSKNVLEQFGLERMSATTLVKWSLLVYGAMIFIDIPFNGVIQAVFNATGIVGGIIFYLLVRGKKAREQFGLERLSVTRLAKWSLLVCGAVIFIEIPLDGVVQAAFNAMHLPHPEQETVVTFRQYNKAAEIVNFLVQAVVIAPLFEELFFRGFLQTFLKNYTSTWMALVLSAGVFAFVHVNLGSVLQLWFLGLALGLAYEYTGALLLPIGIHSCFNFATALSLLLEKGTS